MFAASHHPVIYYFPITTHLVMFYSLHIYLFTIFTWVSCRFQNKRLGWCRALKLFRFLSMFDPFKFCCYIKGRDLSIFIYYLYSWTSTIKLCFFYSISIHLRSCKSFGSLCNKVILCSAYIININIPNMANSINENNKKCTSIV